MGNNITPEIELNTDSEDRMKAYAERLKEMLTQKEDKK